MGNLKIATLIDGVAYERRAFNSSSERFMKAHWLWWQHNWSLIQEITFGGEDLEITIELAGKENIRWIEYNVPQSAVEIIQQIQPYQDAYNEIERLSRTTSHPTVANNDDVRRNAERILGIFENLKVSNLIENASLLQGERARALRHTINKEVSALCRVTAKSSKRIQSEAVDDVQRHLIPEIDDIMRRLLSIKFKKSE